ncbi:hypothetical protein [Streptomyces sp. B21-083]|uniref:hypothetical protein n=1 Tax=Streptomyces sp. B21-083 TaxID=3039410 RepID=UPI002FF28FF2
MGRGITHRHRQAHTVLPGENLAPYAGEVFGRVTSSGHLRGLPRQEFLFQLAELYCDMNVLSSVP